MQTPAGWIWREQGSQGAENSHTAKTDLLHDSQQWASVARVAHHVLGKSIVSRSSRVVTSFNVALVVPHLCPV